MHLVSKKRTPKLKEDIGCGMLNVLGCSVRSTGVSSSSLWRATSTVNPAVPLHIFLLKILYKTFNIIRVAYGVIMI